MGNSVLANVRIVVVSILVNVMNQLSVLIVGNFGVSRKTASYHLSNKSKARLKTTFHSMTEARATFTRHM